MADMDRRRILVVDDEERMVRFIRMNLEHDGFQVGEAFNGKQAIQKIRDFTPDLILLDVMMPDIDGFDVLETIRDFSNVPVIMLTAKGEDADRIAGLELGAGIKRTTARDNQCAVGGRGHRRVSRPFFCALTPLYLSPFKFAHTFTSCAAICCLELSAVRHR